MDLSKPIDERDLINHGCIIERRRGGVTGISSDSRPRGYCTYDGKTAKDAYQPAYPRTRLAIANTRDASTVVR